MPDRSCLTCFGFSSQLAQRAGRNAAAPTQKLACAFFSNLKNPNQAERDVCVKSILALPTHHFCTD